MEKRFPRQIEHLIGDGGSADGTGEVLQQYVRRNTWAQIYVNKGLSIPATLNSLLVRARGAWVVILNGDDYFDVDGLAATLPGLDLCSDAAIICGQIAILSSTHQGLGSRGCNPARLNDFMSVNHPAMVVRRDVFGTIGLFDLQAPAAYDYIWTWRAYKHGIVFVTVAANLAYVRLGGLSSRVSARAAKEILISKIRAGCVLSASRNYAIYCMKSLCRKALPRALERKVTRWYRRFSHSIDNYS